MKRALTILLAFPMLIQAGTLEFKKPINEEKATMDATIVVSDFPFTNNSDKPVTISKADPTCTCVKVEISGGKLKYAPGESGVIRATFDIGNSTGLVEKGVAVYLENDPLDKPSLMLQLKIQVPVLIALEPKTLSWSIGEKAEAKTIQIQIAEGQSVNILSATSSNPVFDVEIKTLEKGTKYELIVTPKALETACIGVIRIETDSKISKQKTVQAFAVVRRDPVAKDISRK